MTQNVTKSTNTEARARAAVLLAEDDLTDEQIAAMVGVTRRTLARWKTNADFAALVGDHVGELQAAMLRLTVAKKRERMKVLDRLHEKLLTVIDERAEEYAALAEQQAAEPDTKRVYRQVFGGSGTVPAGGGTGLIVRQLKVVGAGPMAREIEEFAVDTGLVREIRAVHEQAAKELGQWVERSEVDQRTTMVEIVGVDTEAI
jgi:transcriptional regulator with XRE-family HTH domain